MKVICKMQDAECPRGYNICCATCGYMDSCIDSCGVAVARGYKHCPDADIPAANVAQFESAVPDTIRDMTRLLQMKKQIDEQEKQMKQELLKAMEAHGVKSFETEFIKLTYVAPSTKTTLDSAKLKVDHPDIVEQYSKTSNVAASVRITMKG